MDLKKVLPADPSWPWPPKEGGRKRQSSAHQCGEKGKKRQPGYSAWWTISHQNALSSVDQHCLSHSIQGFYRLGGRQLRLAAHCLACSRWNLGQLTLWDQVGQVQLLYSVWESFVGQSTSEDNILQTVPLVYPCVFKGMHVQDTILHFIF